MKNERTQNSIMENNAAELIETLRPQNEGVIMDLVAEAGIDVAPWAKKSDGSSVKNPRANPHYCYEWAFGGNAEPTALCVWHRDIKPIQGRIIYEDSLRQFALKLDVLAIDRSNPASVRSRTRDQAKRARKFDSLLQRAYRNSNPIRVVLLLGEDKGTEKLGWDTSKVKYRSLDSENWYVHSYSDHDGSFELVRGILSSGEPQKPATLLLQTKFVDQFSLPYPPDKRESKGLFFSRSEEVRKSVLSRAAGVCQACGQLGFRMSSGATYLETHHVIALSEGGPDKEWNVVAICPNDHRRAHYGEDNFEFRDQLIEKLLVIYPGARNTLRELLVSKSSSPKKK